MQVSIQSFNQQHDYGLPKAILPPQPTCHISSTYTALARIAREAGNDNSAKFIIELWSK